MTLLHFETAKDRRFANPFNARSLLEGSCLQLPVRRRCKWRDHPGKKLCLSFQTHADTPSPRYADTFLPPQTSQTLRIVAPGAPAPLILRTPPALLLREMSLFKVQQNLEPPQHVIAYGPDVAQIDQRGSL